MLAANLDPYVEHTDKEAFHEHSPYVYTEKYNTFTSLKKPGKKRHSYRHQQVKTPAQ